MESYSKMFPHVPQHYEIFHMISVILLHYNQILVTFLDIFVGSITSQKTTITSHELAAFCLACEQALIFGRGVKRVSAGGSLHSAPK